MSIDNPKNPHTHVEADPEFAAALLAFLHDYPVERYCHDAHKALCDAADELQKVGRVSQEEHTIIMNCLRLLRSKINE